MCSNSVAHCNPHACIYFITGHYTPLSFITMLSRTLESHNSDNTMSLQLFASKIKQPLECLGSEVLKL